MVWSYQLLEVIPMLENNEKLSTKNTHPDFLPPKERLKLLVLEADEETLNKVIAAINKVCGMDSGGIVQ
jgi:hypothetical protein